MSNSVSKTVWTLLTLQYAHTNVHKCLNEISFSTYKKDLWLTANENNEYLIFSCNICNKVIITCLSNEKSNDFFTDIMNHANFHFEKLKVFV